MNQAEAVALLATDLPAEEREGMNALADRVGEMPLALTLINRLLRHRVHETSQTLSDALTYVNSALDKRGPSFFDPSDEADQETIAKTFGASLDLLTDDERARYQELAVFPPGTDIPVSTVQKLWQRTGNLDEFDTEELFSRFNRLSILDSFDAGKRQIRIHRLIHQYLVETQRAALPALHRQLLEAHRPNPESAPLRAGITARIDGWAALPDDEPYLWDNLSHHLVAGGLGRELVSTVLNLPYLAIKTSLCGTLAVESDLSAAEGQAPEDEVTKALAKRFKQNGHIISRGKDLGEIASTLFCRLSGLDEVRLVYLESCLSRPYLAPAHLFPDLPSPSLLRVFVGHSRSVTGCAFGNDGTLIVSASKDKTLKLWDAKTGRESGALRGHVDEVNACAISGDGSLIVSAAADKTLIVWDTATQTEIRRIFGHSQSVLDCQIFPDGRRILSASADGVLKVWDAMTGELLTTLSGHEKPVNGCAVSCDGKLALSCSDDGTLKLWDTDAGGNPISTQSHRSRINDCALITSPILLIGAFKDRILKTWLSQRGQWSLVRQSTLRGHTRKVNCCAVNQEGTRIISGSADHMVKVWDMDSQRELATLRGHTAWVNDCAISPDDKTAVTASNDGTLRLWDLSITSDPGVLSKHTLWTTRCAISADGKILITSSDDNNVRIWDTESGQEISVLRGHKGWVRDCAMSSDGSIIVSASWDRTVGVWDARTGERQHTLKYPGRPNSCAISRDGSRLFLGFEDGSVRLVDAAAGVTLTVLDAHPLEVNRCAIDQQSFFLWSASSDKTVKVWEISTGKLIKSIEGHSGSINDVAISPDGSFAVSASSDSELRVWDTTSWTNRFTLKGHSEAVLGCAISTDGALIASVSRDSSLKVWDASQGRCLATLYTDAWLFGCAWFPDGKQLAAVGAAGGVYFVNYVQDKDSSIGSPGIRFDAARAERPAV
jgi:WD40 repeat protein